MKTTNMSVDRAMDIIRQGELNRAGVMTCSEYNFTAAEGCEAHDVLMRLEQAAPELYQALQAIVAAPYAPWGQHEAKARAALAKAEGRIA